MEYQIYVNDQESKAIKLATKGPELISEFNNSKLASKYDIMLMPEFGSWMIEAVPKKPYDSLVDAGELLSCEEKLHYRRFALKKFCKEYGVQLASLANVPTLGTPNHILL